MFDAMGGFHLVSRAGPSVGCPAILGQITAYDSAEDVFSGVVTAKTVASATGIPGNISSNIPGLSGAPPTPRAHTAAARRGRHRYISRGDTRASRGRCADAPRAAAAPAAPAAMVDLGADSVVLTVADAFAEWSGAPAGCAYEMSLSDPVLGFSGARARALRRARAHAMICLPRCSVPRARTRFLRQRQLPLAGRARAAVAACSNLTTVTAGGRPFTCYALEAEGGAALAKAASNTETSKPAAGSLVGCIQFVNVTAGANKPVYGFGARPPARAAAPAAVQALTRAGGGALRWGGGHKASRILEEMRQHLRHPLGRQVLWSLRRRASACRR